MSRVIRFNIAAADFAADLVRQCQFSRRFRSRFLAERPTWESSRLDCELTALESVFGGVNERQVAEVGIAPLETVFAPLVHYVFEEIELETLDVKALNKNFVAAAALDFLKANIARTEDDFPYYEKAFTPDESEAIKAAVSDLKRILTLAEPERSIQAETALRESLSTIAVEEEGAHRELLDQLERVFDAESDSVVLKGRHEARVIDFLKTPK